MHELLIGFSVPFSSGIDSLKQALIKTSRFVNYSAISTCYASIEQGQYTRYICVGRGQSQFGFGELLSEIKLEENKALHKFEILLLSYENVVRLDPHMTLPHPHLMQDHTILQAASEVWGAFFHPVAEKSLDEMKLDFVLASEFEFTVSGRELIRLLK